MERRKTPIDLQRQYMAKALAARADAIKKRMEIRNSTPFKWSWKFAVRYKCRNCTNNQYEDIRKCNVLTCSCWPGRLGKLCTIEEMKKWSEEFMKSDLNREIAQIGHKKE